MDVVARVVQANEREWWLSMQQFNQQKRIYDYCSKQDVSHR